MERKTSDWYRDFGEVDCKSQSAVFENWALGIAADAEVLGLIEQLPLQKRQPNLLFAVARLLGAPLADYSVFRAWLKSNWIQVATEARVRSTQTNEPRRCAVLLPALGQISEPIGLIELGASAGLCLIPDRYSYAFGAETLDPDAGRSTVLIESSFTGAVPLPSVMPRIQWRAGVDLNPLDVCNDDDVKWLETLVWPEQTERLARIRAAIDLARLDPPKILQADAIDGLRTLLGSVPEGLKIVIWTPAMLVYLPFQERMRLVEEIRSHNAVWLSLDALRVLPEVDAKLHDPEPGQFTLSRNGEPIANVGPHGQFVDWL